MELTQEQTSLRAQELVRTVNSYGWTMAMEIAEQSVQEAVEALLNNQDSAKTVNLQLKAQASREFLTNFKQRIAASMTVGGSNDSNDFVQVATD